MSLSAVVDPSKIEFGQSLPPHGPHTITTHAPGWETAMRFRERDMSLLMQLKSIYPRFAPFGLSAKLCQSLAQKLPLPEGYGCAAFASRDVWASNAAHATSPLRKESERLAPAELRYHVVDVAGTRLFVVGFPRSKAGAAIFQWQHGGLGLSTRVAEALLPLVDTPAFVHVGEFPGGVGAPEPRFFPEGGSHGALRERIAELVMRACVSESESGKENERVRSDDVFLYQTGMAAITRLHEAVAAVRAGPVVVFGAVFHSTYHLFEESEGGIKHYGRADDADVDDFEKYLEAGGECAYVFTEFPSNPILVSVDLMRLRALADRFGFYLVTDDTCAGFANIDLLPAADVVVTSLTKAFSGYADVMAGSVVLNPTHPKAYATLKPTVSSLFHNELFEADAAQLLSNHKDYFPRCAIHNRNATALAAYFHDLVLDSTSPVTQIHYPPYSPGFDHLKWFLRKPTADFEAPGYGCLLSVEFETVEQATAFYDSLNFFQGPHLGAHLTLSMPYNAMVYGRDHPEIHAAYGLRPQQVRISVGLEDQEILLQRCADAMKKVGKVV